MGSDANEKETARKAARALAECAEIFFDRAPVMMHMIDGSGKLMRVNRRWSQRLGYKRTETSGRWSIEFLTEESRARAIEDTLPLFWRVGSARSVGYTFVKRDGRTLGLQVDAELLSAPGGGFFTYAAIRDADDRNQWERASSTLTTLVELAKLQRKYQDILFPSVSDPQVPAPIAATSTEPPAGDVLISLLEIAGDISGSLKALVGLHSESMDAIVEQQQEMLIVMKGSAKPR